ncbi:MAG: hypothetical protein PHV53_06145 [Fermentimonas sp.]|nr:hypothetical protein [Fermentimonas sp.]
MKKIALIEFTTSHTECLYSQILFLQEAGYQITLVCDKKVENIVSEFNIDITTIYFDFSKFSSLLQVRSFLIKHNLQTVILNTAQGNITLKFFVLHFPKRIRFFGIIHNISKLETSTGQKFISRKTGSYFVLSKYQFRNTFDKKGLSFTYFNPSFFPKHNSTKLADVKGDKLWVVIPGALEYKRRDYDYLFDFLGNYKEDKLKFILLGNGSINDGPAIINKIIELNLERYFTFFNYFIPNNVFHYYLKNADYLFPLIHPTTEGAFSYTKYKISGMFPLSLTYNVPLLCHDIFKDLEDLEYPALFYNDQNDLINILKKRLKSERTFILSFEDEKNRYIDFLERN